MEGSLDSNKETDVETPAREVSPSNTGFAGFKLNRTAKTWLQNAKSDASKTTRERVLFFWVKSSGYKDVDDAVARFKTGTVDPAEEGTKLVNYLEGLKGKQKKAPSTIFLWRNVLGSLFRYLVPDMPKDLYKEAKKVDAILLTEKVGLERDEIKTLLEKASAKYRTAISILLSTGCRIGELVSIRVKKLDFAKSPARVGFLAADTKTKKARQSFLSSETVDLIRDYQKSREWKESEYLFASPDDPTQRQSKYTARVGIYDVFESAGLLKKEGKMHVLHPHSFRSINLAFTKATGFPEDWAETLAGHKRGVESTYEIPEERAKLWLEKVEPKFCFLGRASEQEVKSLEQAIDATNKGALELKAKMDAEISKIRKQLEESRKATGPLPSARTRWENHTHEYAQVPVGSPEYQAILEEGGWEMFDKDEKARIFRREKPKA